MELPAPSSTSSKVVALVELDPWAEELLLWGGEPSGSRSSTLNIDFPLPFRVSEVGLFKLRLLLVVPALNLEPLFDFTLPDERPAGMPETGVVLDERLDTDGGCGNEATLTDLRSVFSGLPGIPLLGVDATVSISEAEFDSEDLTSGGLGPDGVRSLGDAWEGDCSLGDSVGVGKFLLGCDVGIGGNDPVGGFVAGRDGCGRVDVEAISVCAVPSANECSSSAQ